MKETEKITQSAGTNPDAFEFVHTWRDTATVPKQKRYIITLDDRKNPNTSELLHTGASTAGSQNKSQLSVATSSSFAAKPLLPIAQCTSVRIYRFHCLCQINH
jgi:hypothetical protein